MMKIVALKYGETVLGEDYIFCGGSKDVVLPISFTIYLIQTENKNILVDVGCDDGAGFPMTLFKKPVEVLAEYGLQPEDITDVIITHAHHDHIEAIRYFETATIHIQIEEYARAKTYLSDKFIIHLIDEEFVLTEHITVKKIGGHSAGSCIVIADDYVFCGDECYYKKCLTDQIMTGAFCDKEKSMQFLSKYGGKQYTQLLCHDLHILEGSVGYQIVCEVDDI